MCLKHFTYYLNELKLNHLRILLYLIFKCIKYNVPSKYLNKPIIKCMSNVLKPWMIRLPFLLFLYVAIICFMNDFFLLLTYMIIFLMICRQITIHCIVENMYIINLLRSPIPHQWLLSNVFQKRGSRQINVQWPPPPN